MKTTTNIIYPAFAAVAVACFGLSPIAQAQPELPALNGDLFVSINGSGFINGTGTYLDGSIYRYRPTGLFRIVGSCLSQPRDVAFDHLGNLFVANTACDVSGTSCQGSVVKITPDGVQSLFATLPGNIFAEGVAFDRAGNLFIAALDNTTGIGPSTIYKFTPEGVQSTFGSTPGTSYDIAFDSAGYLFAADGWFQTIYKFAPDGTRTVFVGPSAFGPDTGPWGLAFDQFGNLFTSTETATPTGTDAILKFTPDGVGSLFATDLDYPRGLAFDRNGNLFVAERGLFAPPGAILKFTPDGVETVFASEVPDPQLLVFQRARP